VKIYNGVFWAMTSFSLVGGYESWREALMIIDTNGCLRISKYVSLYLACTQKVIICNTQTALSKLVSDYNFWLYKQSHKFGS
jgi:hypothetical protein